MINIEGGPRRLTTAEAAARLGVKPATLYAYVSRGVLTRSRTGSGSTFDAVEIERLAATRRGGSRTREPLTFVTAITLIEDGQLRYRGLDARELSRTRSFEDVAGWLWLGRWPDSADDGWVAPPALLAAARSATDGCTPAERWRVAVAAAATADPLRHDHSPASVAAAARGLLAVLVEVLPALGPTPMTSPPSRKPTTEPANRGSRVEAGPGSMASRLWSRLTPLPATAAGLAVLDAALVLQADHELAASTLAARAAASFGADPYAVVGAGMAASSGPRHAASSLQVRPLLARAEAHGAAVALGEILGRGGEIHGFGQPLYPDGDPRATELLARLGDLPRPAAAVEAVLALTKERAMPAPNCDFALAALAQLSLMVPGASEAIFVLGRTAGWIAHAMEEYADRTSFRVRASYVGSRGDPAESPARS
jgi:citrate synthase